MVSASEVRRLPHGRRVKVAGAVICRQQPGTAKGFVFLSLEDETGISNVIVKPRTFENFRAVILRNAFLIVEGILQNQRGVCSVRAVRAQPFGADSAPLVASHDFR